MKRLIAVLIVLLGGVVLTNVAAADDAADVKAAAMARLAARRAGDAASMAKYTHPERTSFSATWGAGRLLEEGCSEAWQKALYDAGFKQDWGIRHLGVQVYGIAAVVTGYVSGWGTNPQGHTSPVSQRFTEVWVKQDGQWKMFHQHRSQLSRREVVTPAATNEHE